MDSHPITAKSLEYYYHIDGDQLERHYKEHLSDFRVWNQLEHADKWMLFPDNMGTHLSIDETSLSNGELYTIVTNKATKGRKDTLIAIIEGTKANEVIQVLEKIPEHLLNQVQEITLDMAESMRKIIRYCFPKAARVIDRFHVQKLAFDAMQEMRIAHRWDAINQEETNDKENAKLDNKRYQAPVFINGDTRKQLLARSRYLLFKSPEKWSDKQNVRFKILFEQYPNLKEAFSLTHSLRMIYNKNTIKNAARLSLAKWYKQVTDTDFKSFNTISATVYTHYDEILYKCIC